MRPLRPLTLTLAALVFWCLSSEPSRATGILSDTPLLVHQFSIGSLVDPPGFGEPMAMAFNGANYWGASGGNTSGTRFVRYTPGGVQTGAFAPGIDPRSLFTDDTNTLFSTDYGGSGFRVDRVDTDGTVSFKYFLSGSLPDVQATFDWRAADGRIYANSWGTVRGYNFATGAHEVSFNLIGWTSSGNQSDKQLAIAGDVILTWGTGGVVEAWNFSGNKLGTTTISGVPDLGAVHHSFAFANGLVWYSDRTDWFGYDIGYVPEPSTVLLVASGLVGLAVRGRRRV